MSINSGFLPVSSELTVTLVCKPEISITIGTSYFTDFTNIKHGASSSNTRLFEQAALNTKMYMTFAERILRFNTTLSFPEELLPEKVQVLNPFEGDFANEIASITHDFYTKYYSDNNKRHLILGINPGRLGAGLTGVPFTDTSRLEEDCNISAQGIETRETSAVFVYDVIRAFGGAEAFYKRFFIGAMSPLGLAKENEKGNIVNYNYYDSTQLIKDLRPYLILWLKQQVELGMNTDKVFVFGTGKNTKALLSINKELQLFDEVVPLEHPRYVMQYKLRKKDEYIDKFLSAFA